jgi:hypothetical protein
VTRPAEPERSDAERGLAEVVRVAPVVALAQRAIGTDGRVGARRRRRIHHQREERGGARDAAMAGPARHLDARRGAVGDGVHAPVDLLDHDHHLPGDQEQGRGPNGWFGNVAAVAPLLQRQAVHQRFQYGYCRCSKPAAYVRKIRERREAYGGWCAVTGR